MVSLGIGFSMGWVLKPTTSASNQEQPGYRTLEFPLSEFPNVFRAMNYMRKYTNDISSPVTYQGGESSSWQVVCTPNSCVIGY